MALSPDGLRAFSQGHLFEKLIDFLLLWDVESGEELAASRSTPSISNRGLAPMVGRRALRHKRRLRHEDSEMVQLWDVETG